MSNRPSPRGWSIEEFAASVCGGQSKHKAVAVIGYFDESGTSSNQKIAMYGGMVAKASEWATIEDEWRAKLAEYDLSEYHASLCENGWKEFSKLRKPIRESLTNYFSTLVSRVRGHAIGSSVSHKAWQDLVPEKIKTNYGGDPLYFAAANLMQRISVWSVEHNDGEPVALMFATHTKHDARLAQLHADFLDSKQWPGLGTILFGEPKLLVPMQTADLICYELKRQLTHPDESRAARITFKNSGRIGMHFYGFDDSALPALVAKWAKLYPQLMD
jgi:Protein of unknown function (DUF3800)